MHPLYLCKRSRTIYSMIHKNVWGNRYFARLKV